ncbi:uncharacterized protein LOC115630088 [Scaptodrosophila lebanonensis]|uniref:Uncharacterized protein LOC115630088 n=1 Tax=Drosophila lebanonensis TaxID=7225 RepID=A0A6J2U3U4_DROLE|nr:uncharacterized protein LOC115630088 [Scaptodrosophila lebanonensis]
MALAAERYEHHRKQLGELLQAAALLIKAHETGLYDEAGELGTQASHLWELSQRHRLVVGSNNAAAATLFSACNDVFQPLYERILKLDETLAEIRNAVSDFEVQCRELQAEQNAPINEALAKCLAWLLQTQSVLQSQAKYLELYARGLTPTLVQQATVDQFKRELQLSEQQRDRILLGLALAEQRTASVHLLSELVAS